MKRDQKLFHGLQALATFTLTLFVTSAWAADQEKVLHSFNNNGTDGFGSVANLIMDTAGNLYGTTENGVIHGDGAVFQLSPKEGGRTETVLHSFNHNGTDGFEPFAGLIFDAAGNLYGTTYAGGIHDNGTVFELSPREGGGWTETVLHSFGAGNDGDGPYAGLILDNAGNLYGTTIDGGIHGLGTVFELSPRESGGWISIVLHSFNGSPDGVYSSAPLITDDAGNLYGTTSEGGIHGYGTVFELIPNLGGGWSEKSCTASAMAQTGHIPSPD